MRRVEGDVKRAFEERRMGRRCETEESIPAQLCFALQGWRELAMAKYGARDLEL